MGKTNLQEGLSKSVYREIIEQLMRLPHPTPEDVNRIKISICDKFQVPLPRNSDLIRVLAPNERERLLSILKIKAVRMISGVNVVAVMTKPWPCPHGKCAYCPGGPDIGTPQSYVGLEPAAMRGAQHGFDPYLQVKNRIEQLIAIGSSVSKVDVIIMGGTFPAMPIDYQEYFVKRCLEAIAGSDSASLKDAIRKNETSQMRNVGITVETRPDYAKEKQVDHLLKMGVTRVELGVQNIYDDIYQLVERGHTVQDVVDATRILKDSGLRVGYHMMPNLPHSNFRRDLEAFRTIFTDSRFKPDMLKIYPCLVVKGTKLYDWWREGRYEPYSTEEVIRLLVEIKKMAPPWVRIMRIQRDIPAGSILAGVKKGDLRNLVKRQLEELGLRCRCIRCREVGHRYLNERIIPRDVKILTHKEEASNGIDLFLSVEDPVQDILIGYLRLRKPSEKAHRPEISGGRATIIRELRVCGPVVPLGEYNPEAWQHRGYGASLLHEAEEMAKQEFDSKKMVITSAIGTRDYYRRYGYTLEEPYMVKNLN